MAVHSYHHQPKMARLVPIVQSDNDYHFVDETIKEIQDERELKCWSGMKTGALVFIMGHSLLKLTESPEAFRRNLVKQNDILSQYLKVSEIVYRDKQGKLCVLDVMNIPDTTFLDEPNRRMRVNFVVPGASFGIEQTYVFFCGRLNTADSYLTMYKPECDEIEILGFNLFGHRVDYYNLHRDNSYV